MRQIIKNKNSGFTLMGVIFAIGIILVGLVGILSLFRYVIVAGRISADRFIATNLASEGIEIVRAVRDDNWKKAELDLDPIWEASCDPNCWKYGLAPGEYYQADYNDPGLTTVNPSTPLKIDTSGYYSYDNGQNSKYTRRIYIYDENSPSVCPLDDTAPTDQNICVLSAVTWQMLGNTYSATVADRLYDWK